MPRVLVTGSSGFIGRAAVAALRRRGLEVHGLARDQVDLLDGEAVSRIVREIGATHLLHLAWYTEHGVYWSSPLNQRWVDASEHLFREFLDAGGTRIVAAGTCAEYDWSGGLCVEESTPLRPATIYGAAKAELRRRLAALRASHVWARLFFVYGPHEPPAKFIPSTIRSLLRGGEVTCRNPEARRDFIHVDDAGEALAVFVDGDAAGAVNVGSGIATPLGTVASMIAEILGGAPASPPVRAGEDAGAPLVVADTTRLAGLFGFQPRIDLVEGLQRTIAWWENAP